VIDWLTLLGVEVMLLLLERHVGLEKVVALFSRNPSASLLTSPVAFTLRRLLPLGPLFSSALLIVCGRHDAFTRSWALGRPRARECSREKRVWPRRETLADCILVIYCTITCCEIETSFVLRFPSRTPLRVLFFRPCVVFALSQPDVPGVHFPFAVLSQLDTNGRG